MSDREQELTRLRYGNDGSLYAKANLGTHSYHDENIDRVVDKFVVYMQIEHLAEDN